MEFKRARRRDRKLDLTPLIDVVFLLIVFLILTTNFQQPSLTLDLPSGTSDENADREDAVLIELDARGHLALDGVGISQADLISGLQDRLASSSEAVVRLLADQDVAYGDLLPLIDLIRSSGARAIDLVHGGKTP